MRLRRRIYRQCKWDRRNVFKFLCFHIHANSPRRGLNPSLLRDACSQTLSKRKKNLYKNHVEKNGNKILFFSVRIPEHPVDFPTKLVFQRPKKILNTAWETLCYSFIPFVYMKNIMFYLTFWLQFIHVS